MPTQGEQVLQAQRSMLEDRAAALGLSGRWLAERRPSASSSSTGQYWRVHDDGSKTKKMGFKRAMLYIDGICPAALASRVKLEPPAAADDKVGATSAEPSHGAPMQSIIHAAHRDCLRVQVRVRDEDSPQKAADAEGQAASKRMCLEQAPDERARELREAQALLAAEASASEAERQLRAAEEQLVQQQQQFDQQKKEKLEQVQQQVLEQRSLLRKEIQQRREEFERQRDEQLERVQKLRETAEQQRAAVEALQMAQGQ